MALKAEGIWPCTVLSGSYGEDPKKEGVTRVQVNVTIDEGPSKGQFCTYQDDVNHRSALYIMRSIKNVGWKGGKTGDDLNTLEADVAAWVKETGGKALVEIKHIAIRNGERAGQVWDKVNSIRRTAAPLKAASPAALADAREAMRAAMRDEGIEPPADDVPHASTSDDIPF